MRNIPMKESLGAHSKQLVHSNTEHLSYSLGIPKTQRAEVVSLKGLVHLERSAPHVAVAAALPLHCHIHKVSPAPGPLLVTLVFKQTCTRLQTAHTMEKGSQHHYIQAVLV